jgi:hypothetical protein
VIAAFAIGACGTLLIYPAPGEREQEYAAAMMK